MLKKLIPIIVTVLTLGITSYAVACGYGPDFEGIGYGYSRGEAKANSIRAWHKVVRPHSRKYYVDWNQSKGRDPKCYPPSKYKRGHRHRHYTRHVGYAGEGPYSCYVKTKPKRRYN